MDTIEDPIKAANSRRKRKRRHEDPRGALLQATANEVGEQSDEIAKALVDRVIHGDVNCAKLLLALLDELPQPKSKNSSFIRKLVNAPQWTGPPPEEDENEDAFELNAELEQRIGKIHFAALVNDRIARRKTAAENAAPQK